eukprot:jgi/Ulvmu1/8614/UM046_0012.1
MSTVTSFAEAVQFAARCIECPICKEACENPVRPKNCSHRYCMGCFRKCFQDKQEKHCATCRTPILSVSKRGFTEDDLFAKVALLVPGIREAESDNDFDLAKMMERHRQQSAKIRQEAVMMRQNMPNKQPVTHATRQHPERTPTPPTMAAQAAAPAQAPLAGAPPPTAPAASSLGGLPPLDPAARPPLPALAAGAPAAADWNSTRAPHPPSAPQHGAWGAAPPAAPAAADEGSLKRELDGAAAGNGAGGAGGPDAKRAKGSDPA